MKIREGLLGRVKMKHVWVLTLASLLYIIYRQGWPSVGFDNMVLKAVAVWIGGLIGFGIDSVHFYRWKPSSNDPTPTNMLRRAALIGVGMLAMALSV